MSRFGRFSLLPSGVGQGFLGADGFAPHFYWQFIMRKNWEVDRLSEGKNFWDWLENFFELGALVSFAGLIYVVLLQVYARLFLPRSPHWTEEASRFLFLTCIAFSAAVATRRRAFVNVDVFLHMLGAKAQRFIILVSDVTVLLFMAFVTYYAWLNAEVGAMQTSPSLAIPMQYVFGSVVLLSVGVCLFSIEKIYEDVKTPWTM